MSIAEDPGHGPQVRLAASPHGVVAVVEPGRVLVLGVPDLREISEIGIAGQLEDNDVAFARARLVVLERAGTTARLHVVDPAGPTKLAELPFRTTMRILAVAGDHVLATGPGGTTLVDVSRPELTAMTLPARGPIHAAGRIGTSAFVLAASGVLEHWDAEDRKPLRRLRLEQAVEPAFVGGSADLVWMIPRDVAQVEVIALARKSTRAITLVAPPSRVAANASGELLAVICGEDRSTYVVDLARRVAPLRIDRGPMADVTWIGAHSLALHAVGQAVELLAIPVSSEPLIVAPRAAEEPAPGPPADQLEAIVPHRDEVAEDLPPTRWSREEISDRLADWRERARTQASSPAGPASQAEPVSPVPAPARELPAPAGIDPPHAGGWRAELARWARSICARSYRRAPIIARGILDEVAARLDLGDGLRDAIAVLYGAYLNGTEGIAPIDLAAVLDWRWDEAVGDGRLARSGAVRWQRGRIALHREVIAALDERPPRTGTIVGTASPAAATVALIVPGDVDVTRIGAWAAPVVGTLLVPNAAGERTPHRFLFEARLRGLVPLVLWSRFADLVEALPRPAVVIVEHATVAAGLDLQVAATWAAGPRIDRATGI